MARPDRLPSSILDERTDPADPANPADPQDVGVLPVAAACSW
jgi:hypothetical protein